jgi:hypothetical protein
MGAMMFYNIHTILSREVGMRENADSLPFHNGAEMTCMARY